jgi:autotransporter-associated beta strand protein
VSFASTNTAATTFSNSLAGVGRIDLGSGTRTFDIADSTTLADATPEVSVGWTVTGSSANLRKTGSGVLALNAVNTYAGTTTIDGGILAVNGSLASGSAVTVNSGGTLGGTGTVNGTVAVKSGGIVGPGNGPGVLTTGAATFESGSIFSWQLNNNLDGDTGDAGDTGARGTNYDGLTSSSLTVASGAIFRVVLTGTADITDTFWDQTQEWNNIFSVSGTTTNAAPGQLFNAFEVYNGTSDVTLATTSSQGSFSFDGSTLTWTAVPEPSSALAGLLIAAGLLRRRRVA